MTTTVFKTKIETLYRRIMADLTIDGEEAQELVDFFTELNPPPDTLVLLRATAFRIGSELLVDDDRDRNVSILRTINAVVHALEKCRMQPREVPSSATDSFEEQKVTDLYKTLFTDLSIDAEENEELISFFSTKNPPPVDKLIITRASAFRVGCDFLGDDKQTNIKLLRCINVVVHDFEQCCLQPRPYHMTPTFSTRVTSSKPSSTSTAKTTTKVGNVRGVSLEDAVQRLWDLDVNRLSPNEDYVIDVQGGKKPYWKEDNARDPLFTRVDERQFRNRPTYKAFCALLDNYIAETGVSEVVTNEERRETSTFLRVVMETAPMQYCHQYCVANAPKSKHVPSDRAGFIKFLHKIWFKLYSRSRGSRGDSSGFEHVFVGEVKNNAVSGFHNWLQLYYEEKKGALDYRGYIKPRSRSDARTDDDDHVLTLQFNWNGIEKTVGTSFIGTSPEFELALYTMCFVAGEENNAITLDTGSDIFDLNIRCYQMGKDMVGTSFPEAKAHYEA
eukprot:CAMPEP_0194130756 /NCGR_PEP_ID=MMETSP0152-20130528/1722_1 /TAXON_ID=1049557 /ORGANISM="Thalassiothrix antarctica, Strain L6-D1" /LENGTH=501 /DNA_ID=CAMNT_0038825365 /DNA_START=165 /DNA_END=1670 /DNA_ORIENTATION=-